jgi:hypothetical protein
MLWPRFEADSGLQPLLNHALGRVYADELETVWSGVAKAVRRPGFGHDYVTGARLDLLGPGSEDRPAGADDPCLGVGMAVQPRTLIRSVVHMEERDSGSVGLTLELHGATRMRGRVPLIG